MQGIFFLAGFLLRPFTVTDEVSKANIRPGCSKLTASLVNVSLKFQTLVSQISQYFWLKKNVRSFCSAKSSHFFNKKYQCILLSRKSLNELIS